MTLLEKQIQRQDFVDNAIHKIINELIPNENTLDWDIETIVQVRDAISQVVAKKGICTEQDEEGEKGDVRDIIIARSRLKWEIGLSIKHNAA